MKEERKMQILIDIDEEYYKIMKEWNDAGVSLGTTDTAIANGTPLPKGHGDLKDADKLKHAFIKWSMAVQGSFTELDIASIVYNSPTIIEADRK